MLIPDQALAPSRFALISTDPVGWTKRRRTPVEVARNVVSTMWWANPYSVSVPANPTDRARATSAKAPAPVAGIGSPQSAGSPEPVSSGALSLAAGAAWATSSAAATKAVIASASAALDRTEPTCAESPWRTMEITAMERLVATPLVVIELPAQRSEASDRSVTITMVSAARPEFAAAANARSTTD